jgi:hypothetical protein
VAPLLGPSLTPYPHHHYHQKAPPLYQTLQTSLEALTIDDPIIEQIKHMELERTTPLDALNQLKEMQDEIQKRKT